MQEDCIYSGERIRRNRIGGKYIMDKCFADKGNECSALTKKECQDCGFFKTEEQHQKDKKKVFNRLSKLGLTYLLKKYKE
jgi:hypothetical protein